MTQRTWLIWSVEHDGYWPQSRCGYVRLEHAGRFTLDEAKEIVEQGNLGMTNNVPQECMLPEPHPVIIARAMEKPEDVF